MAVLLFFIDGFGLGEADKKTNPVYRYGLWKKLIGKNTLVTHEKVRGKYFTMIPTDAHLDVPGIPQSATGQTALFTGVNAPEIIGGHITGLPGEHLSKILLESSFLKTLRENGFQVTSANAYSTEYFEKVRKRSRRVSATTLAIQAAGIDFRMMEDLKQGKAVFMDLTHHILKTRYPDVVEISPARAAENLKNILGEHDVVMFEYFLTDFMGHKGSAKEKKFILNHLDRFLKKLIGKLDMKNNTVVICSDHGNIEDERGKQHTENPVPTLVFSENPEVLDYFEDKVKRITEVAPAIIQGFERGIFNPAAPADER
jgi:hypothetical protein